MPHIDTTNVYFIASVWMALALALAASLSSIRLGVLMAHGGVMKSGSEGLRLRVFVHEALRYEHKPLYRAIVERARRDGLAGATVFRGCEGYGLHRHLHTTRLVDVSDDLPVIVEIVDSAEAIRRFLAALEPLIPHGTATLSPVSIVKYSAGEPA